MPVLGEQAAGADTGGSPRELGGPGLWSASPRTPPLELSVTQGVQFGPLGGPPMKRSTVLAGGGPRRNPPTQTELGGPGSRRRSAWAPPLAMSQLGRGLSGGIVQP